jgi:hypothetical protein
VSLLSWVSTVSDSDIVRYILPDLIEIDSAIKERESLCGRGAWHSNLPFFAFQRVWQSRFGGLPVSLIAFKEDSIGQEPERFSATMFVVEGGSRRNFRDAAGSRIRKDLRTEPSALDCVFDKHRGIFVVDQSGLIGSPWLNGIALLINAKIADLFKWAGPSRSHRYSITLQFFYMFQSPEALLLTGRAVEWPFAMFNAIDESHMSATGSFIMCRD